MEHKLTYISKEKVGEDLYVFTFSKPDTLSWISGQHGGLYFEKEIENDRGRRTLSIASSKSEQNIIFILKITEQKSNYKKALLELKEGDEMIFNGPVGMFHLEDKEDKPFVCIAGGVGIAPFRPMIRDIKNNQSIELVYSAKPNHFAFSEDLNEYAQKENVTVHYAENKEDAKKITTELIQKHENNAHYMICGTPAMVEAYKELLAEQGIDQTNIILDIFSGYN